MLLQSCGICAKETVVSCVFARRKNTDKPICILSLPDLKELQFLVAASASVRISALRVFVVGHKGYKKTSETRICLQPRMQLGLGLEAYAEWASARAPKTLSSVH